MRLAFPGSSFCTRQLKLPRLAALAFFAVATFGLASSTWADTPGGLPAASAADALSTPKKAGTAFAKALMAGNIDDVKKTAVGTDKEFAIVQSIGDMMQAMKQYEAAAVKKFGDDGKMSKDENKDLVAEVENSDEKIEGEKASLINKANPNDKNPMTLKKDATGWKVDLSTLSKDPEAAKITDMSKAMVAALNATAKDVDAGKYKTAKEAKDAMGAAMLKAMLEAQAGK